MSINGASGADADMKGAAPHQQGHLLVRMRGIVKSFGPVMALRGADLDLGHREVLGLVGDNAAGKSTLMKILTGVHKPDEGQIHFDGKQVHFHSPQDSRAIGIEMIYQNLALAPNLDVVANVFLGREYKRPLMPRLVGWLDESRMERETYSLLNRLRINIASIRTNVERMSGGQRQAVAIARAVAFQARVVIMDEPTAALAVKEVGKVLDLIKNLRDSGVSVILISHRLQDVFNVCDRVMVLRSGQRISERVIKETTMDETVKYIVGAETGDLARSSSDIEARS
jgi:simple sugar transport system ATP-binding protein